MDLKLLGKLRICTCLQYDELFIGFDASSVEDVRSFLNNCFTHLYLPESLSVASRSCG